MDVQSQIIALIEPSLEALGYSLVQVKLTDATKSKTLMIMAERKDDVNMSFDDCTLITQTASALLDVDELIPGAYNLEVCSPGIDRPLVKHADYTRFAGNEIKAETIIPVAGRKRFRGILKGIKGEMVTVTMPEGEFELPFAHIRTAKLIDTIPALVAGSGKKGQKKPINKLKS